MISRFRPSITTKIIILLATASIIFFVVLRQPTTNLAIEDIPSFAHAAVIVDDQANEALIRAILNVIKNIPPDWPIQIMTPAENYRFLNTSVLEKYMSRGKIFMTPFNYSKRNSLISTFAYRNKILTSLQFWRQVRGEKILLFQTDSTFCSNSSYKLIDFLEYDFIGAPWHSGGCCSGGISLRSRKKILQVLNRMKYTGKSNEDEWYSQQLVHVNASIPPREVARTFSVQTIYQPYPLTIYKPMIEYIGIENMRHLCNECPEAQIVVPYCFR
jgi:hypothetical protein